LSQFACFSWFDELFSLGVRRLRVLSDLGVGESGVLVALDLPPGVQNHLMYMGFVPDAHVKALHRAPIGDPTVYSVDGIEIALRRETAKAIKVRALSDAVPVMVVDSNAALNEAAEAAHEPVESSIAALVLAGVTR
jgi:ferrous iron transport protein A